MRSTLVLLLVAGACAAQQGAGASEDSGASAKDPGGQRVIIQFSDPALDAPDFLERKALELESKPGVLQAKGLKHVRLVVAVCDSLASTERLMYGLEEDPAVEFATPDTDVYFDQAVPPAPPAEEDNPGRGRLRGVAKPSIGGHLAQCTFHPGCAALNLTGDCCPASDGSLLACCGHSEAEITYAFRSAYGSYLVAEVWGPIRADRETADSWEKFEVVHHDDGTISLKTFFGTYMSAPDNGTVLQNNTVGEAERFTLLHNDDGTVSLQTTRGTYLSVTRDARVLAGSDSLLSLEKLTLVRIGQAGQRFPNDARFDDLWGMHIFDDMDIDCPEAWDTFTGEGNNSIIVGVIDTGIDYTHRDLRDNMWVNPNEIPDNGIDDDGNGIVDDVHGADFINNDGDPMDDQSHGTHCAGTIAAAGDDGIGVSGVAWRGVRLMALKFLSSRGSGKTSDAVKAIDYAVAHGAKILSNSWGGGGSNAALSVAIQRAQDAGILFPAAAGNRGTDNDNNPHYPSSYTNDNIIAVASTSRTGALSSFSCYGHATVHVAAPGSQILSTVPDQRYRFLSGTSMATPAVSGLAALVWMYRPKLEMLQVKEIIMSTVTQYPALEGKIITGGRVNAAKALAAAAIASPTFLPPVHAPQAIAFEDVDPTVGIVSGIVTITTALNESDIEYYRVYFLSSAGYPMGVAGHVNATGARLLEVSLSPPMPMPKFAVGLVAVSGNATGETSGQTGGSSPELAVKDYGIPESGPEAVSWGGDTDAREGWVAGRLTLKRAPNEASITGYNIYWNLTAGGRGPLVASVPAIGYRGPSCRGEVCAVINQTRLPNGGTQFNHDGYKNNEQAMITVSGPGRVVLTRFDTEQSYDVLTVASQRISGRPGVPLPLELPAGPNHITWVADWSIVHTGWTFEIYQDNYTVDFQLEASQALGPGLEVVAEYFGTELPEGAFVAVTDYCSDMPPSPAFAPEAIIFRNQDNTTGVIAGVAEVRPAPNASSGGGVAYYTLELADAAGEPIVELGRVTASGDDALRFSIPAMQLPAEAVQLLARAGNRFGLSSGKTLVNFVDVPSPDHSPPEPVPSDGDGVAEPEQGIEPWLLRAGGPEERRAIWPTRPAELPRSQWCLRRSCVLGKVTVPSLDAHDLAAQRLLRAAVGAAVADVLPHTAREGVEVVSVAPGAGDDPSKEESSGAVVEFLVAPGGGAPASALYRIEARLILLSKGGGSAVRLSRALLERLAEAGATLPASTLARVGEPQRLMQRQAGRALAAGESGDAPVRLQSGRGILV